MERTFEDQMKKTLQNMKEDIIKNLISENEDFKAIIEDIDPKDFADIAADDIDRKTLEALSTNEIKRLRLIDNAISRLENGKYGNLVDPSDPDALADAALDIIANPAPALAKLKAARATVLLRYTKEESVRRHANLYMRLVEDFGRSNRT